MRINILLNTKRLEDLGGIKRIEGVVPLAYLSWTDVVWVWSCYLSPSLQIANSLRSIRYSKQNVRVSGLPKISSYLIIPRI